MSEGLADGGTACAAPRGDADLPPGPLGRVLEQVSAVADAVLYEGYLLYPYRRSSAKNRVRWQFGVLFPRDWVEADGPVVPGLSGSADSWYQQTECLLRIRRPDACVRVRLRYLQMQRKQVMEASGPGGGHRAVESLRTDDGTVHLTFDEAVPREAEVTVPLADLPRSERTQPVGAAAGVDVEPLPGHAGRVERRREEVAAHITVAAEPLDADLVRLRVRTANTGAAPESGATRDEALRGALIATHTVIGGDGVEFVSLIDPPAELAAQARACRNEFTFPVLGGTPGADACGTPGTAAVLLSAPIILPDHPQVAPESPGDLHDAAEIDEILSLRTLLLTDEEKREARATDARAAAILDRVESMPPEVFARLHGAVRSLAPVPPVAASVTRDTAPVTRDTAPVTRDTAPVTRDTAPVTRDTAPVTRDTAPVTRDTAPVTRGTAPAPPPAAPDRPSWWQEGADDGLAPSTDTVLVDGVSVGGGSRVRLRPRRNADAQDMFLAGRTAEVAAVFHDVDDSVHLAVTLDDDPASELHTWYGRFHYFRPDELEPLEPKEPLESAPESAPSETPRSKGR